jgi:hypothetical protein
MIAATGAPRWLVSSVLRGGADPSAVSAIEVGALATGACVIDNDVESRCTLSQQRCPVGERYWLSQSAVESPHARRRHTASPTPTSSHARRRIRSSSHQVFVEAPHAPGGRLCSAVESRRTLLVVARSSSSRQVVVASGSLRSCREV